MPDGSKARTRRRISNACQRCRRKKIRCSGVAPCQGCEGRSLSCVFEDVGKKIMVSESYFRDLVSTVNHYQQNAVLPDDHLAPIEEPQSSIFADQSSFENDEIAAQQPVVQPESGSLLIEEVFPSVQNPLTSAESFYAVDSAGRQRYLGPSSSMSFSWQIRCCLKQAVGEDVTMNLVPYAEEETYSMASAAVRVSLPLTTDDLPTREYAKYLAETTLFHLGDTHHIFERQSFMARLDEFYGSRHSGQPLNTSWQVQLLVVIAFGKLFLRRGASSLGPPGATDFLRALRLQTDVLDIWIDPVLRIETLCLISLYLQTADMRATAYVFIGQAMRIALSLGMNREPPVGCLDQTEYERRRRLWWTLYIIDVKLSTIAGAPLSIRNEDIDISLPGDLDLEFSNSALILHVKLAALEGKVKSAAYKINGFVNKSFITGIQEVFSSMVQLAENFVGDFSINLEIPSKVSRVAATLQILYYQCSIIATRPILFVLLKQRLAPLIGGTPVVKIVSEPVVALLRTCVGAATKIIRILSIMHDDDLVEPFLPSDLLAVFSAGFILSLISIAYPHIPVDKTCIAKSVEILDWMHSKGNAPARCRRRQLAELQAAADKVDSSCGQTLFDLKTPINDPSWLWEALNIDGSAMNLGLASSADDLTWTNALMAGMTEGMQEHRWFWAGGT